MYVGSLDSDDLMEGDKPSTDSYVTMNLASVKFYFNIILEDNVKLDL